MKRTLFATLCALLAALSFGCGSGDAAAYRNAAPSPAESPPASPPPPSAGAAPGEPRELSGHLTVKSYWDPGMEVYVQDFTRLHPRVTIDLQQFDGEGGLSFDDYVTQTAVELMAGEGADVVDVAGMAVYQYAKSGVFCDLYPLMDADPDFRREDYYTNIFEGKEFQGALYSMPCAFLYDMVCASKPLLEQARLQLPDALDYQEMLRLYQKVLAGVDSSPRMLPGLDYTTFFWYEFPEYYDPETRAARFLSPEFLRYLRLTKELIHPAEESDLTRVTNDDSFLKEDYLFCRFDVTGGTDLYFFLYDLPNVTGLVPMVSSSGKAYFRTTREYAIPSSSGQKELAWEFIKFYIGEKEVPDDLDPEYAQRYYRSYIPFVPINKANFFQGFRFAYQYTLPRQLDDPDTRWRDGDRDRAVEEALERIHSWNQQRNAEQAEGEIYGLLCQDLDRYYRLDLLTPEETARRMQDRMTIFLQE